MTSNNHIYNKHEELIKNEEVAGRPLHDLIIEIQNLYSVDRRPWIIGFSGGKDSTVVLSLIYSALKALPKYKLGKPIYVVSSDTLVETPVVIDLIKDVLGAINAQGKKDNLPISAHTVVPLPDQTFWVNLLGRGYPAPRQKFRWCTERMKIDPVSEFITSKAAEYGEVVVALGSRKQESASRAQVIAKHRIEGSALSRHTTLPNAYTYMPIEDWSADDVWMYLLSAPRPWGGDNQILFELYKDSNQGECPVVIDTSTPSCGNSRFGCWTCTVVTEDKALHSLIDSGMDWMKPLLAFRNELYESNSTDNKSKYRNDKRRTGKITFAKSKAINDDSQKTTKHVLGPYWMKWRQKWVRDLLQIQKDLNEQGHDIQLIHDFELEAIRQQWIKDPNEPDWEDYLPKIYNDIYPDKHINWMDNDSGVFTQHDADLLQNLGDEHNVPAELLMKLIEAEVSVSGLGMRRGIVKKIESLLNNDWESVEHARKRYELDSCSKFGWETKKQELEAKLEQYKTENL